MSYKKSYSIWIAAVAACLLTLAFSGSSPLNAKSTGKLAGGPNDWFNKMDYGPFLAMTVIAPSPQYNTTYKGIVVKLDDAPEGDSRVASEQANIIFDTQLLRYSAGWTGGWLALHGVAYTGDHGVNPSIVGEQKFGTKPVLGWGMNGDFTDPRPEPFGGFPRNVAHYRGLYRHGNQVVFSYTADDVPILDLPGIQRLAGEVAFTRTLQIGPSTQSLTLRLADGKGTAGVGVPGGDNDKTKTVADQAIATIIGNESVVAGAVGPDAAQAHWDVVQDGEAAAIHLVIAPHKEELKLKIVLWGGTKDGVANFVGFLKDRSVPDLAPLLKGGPARWNKEMVTKGSIANTGDPKNAKQAYVLDDVAVPDQNPWNSQLRFGGFDFFPDGHTAALCTWNGDVWVVKGIDDKLDHLTWRRIAGGMFQTLGLKIVDGNIYVMGRDQITILHDLNGDGEADFYENFNNDVAVAPHFHEFAFDLQQDKEGNFYFIKAGGVNAGGQGFMQPITRNHGTVMKVARDGSKLEVIASGFRAPNGMAVGPQGEIVTGDNQGTWTPVDRLNWVKPGGFYGVPELSHRTPEPTISDNPLCWNIYPSWDNSCGDPVWNTSEKFGPTRGELLYLSYGTCSLFHVLKEQAIDGEMQGGLTRFPFRFATGSMRARFNPVDGQLYVCGFKGWQTSAQRDTAFQRVRYTGKSDYMPSALHVKDNGIEISFNVPLRKETAEDKDSWTLEQWAYRWTSNYGSPEVKPSNPAKEGHDPVKVKSAKLSADGKTVFLEIADLRPVMQMLIQGQVDAADGTSMKVEIANTINSVGGKRLEISTKHPTGAVVPATGAASAR